MERQTEKKKPEYQKWLSKYLKECGINVSISKHFNQSIDKKKTLITKMGNFGLFRTAITFDK